MLSQLLALATAAILLILPMQAYSAAVDPDNQGSSPAKVDLPTALDNDFLDDLPFAQRRQILREELNVGGQNNLAPSLPKQFNLLIR